MAAIVHHGRAGTTAATLDASPKPIHREKLIASNMAADIQKALQDDAIQRQARILGEKIRTEDGVEQAVELIENYLKDPEVLMQFNP